MALGVRTTLDTPDQTLHNLGALKSSFRSFLNHEKVVDRRIKRLKKGMKCHLNSGKYSKLQNIVCFFTLFSMMTPSSQNCCWENQFFLQRFQHWSFPHHVTGYINACWVFFTQFSCPMEIYLSSFSNMRKQHANKIEKKNPSEKGRVKSHFDLTTIRHFRGKKGQPAAKYFSRYFFPFLLQQILKGSNSVKSLPLNEILRAMEDSPSFE